MNSKHFARTNCTFCFEKHRKTELFTVLKQKRSTFACRYFLLEQEAMRNIWKKSLCQIRHKTEKLETFSFQNFNVTQKKNQVNWPWVCSPSLFCQGRSWVPCVTSCTFLVIFSAQTMVQNQIVSQSRCERFIVLSLMLARTSNFSSFTSFTAGFEENCWRQFVKALLANRNNNLEEESFQYA